MVRAKIKTTVVDSFKQNRMTLLQDSTISSACINFRIKNEKYFNILSKKDALALCRLERAIINYLLIAGITVLIQTEKIVLAPNAILTKYAKIKAIALKIFTKVFVHNYILI